MLTTLRPAARLPERLLNLRVDVRDDVLPEELLRSVYQQQLQRQRINPTWIARDTLANVPAATSESPLEDICVWLMRKVWLSIRDPSPS